jgi:hypothetical protein
MKERNVRVIAINADETQQAFKKKAGLAQRRGKKTPG